MQHPAWVLVIVGVLIAVIGLVWLLAPRSRGSASCLATSLSNGITSGSTSR